MKYHYNLLRDEEMEREFRSGNREVRDKVIMSYLPQVEYMVRLFWVDEKYEEDMIQAGMLGVVEAFEQIQKSNGNNISKTIRCHVVCSITQYLIDVGLISDPNIKQSWSISRSNSAIDNGPLNRVVSYRDCVSNTETQKDQTVENLALDSVEMGVWLSILSKKEFDVLIRVVGLYGYFPKSYEKVGKELHITALTVSYKYKKAIEKLRTFLKGLEKAEKSFERAKNSGNNYPAANHLTIKRKWTR